MVALFKGLLILSVSVLGTQRLLTMDHVEFGRGVKRLFRFQKDAAGTFGVSAMTVNRWCNDRQRIPPLAVKVLQTLLESAGEVEQRHQPTRVEQRKTSQGNRFSLMCGRIYGSLPAAREALRASQEDFVGWAAGTRPVPRLVWRILSGKVQIGNGGTLSYANDAAPHRMYGVGTPECDFASVASAAKAHGITETTAYSRARRRSGGWHLIDMRPHDVEGSPIQHVPRTRRHNFLVYTPKGTFGTVQAAADAHGVMYNTAYARARYGLMGWSRTR